jgi:histidyl-tRNA synthetase
MFGFGKNKISTDSYKGVRDFYPEDQSIQNYIFDIMKKTVESWGYEEYNASILEPLDLYKLKTSEEIINEQIYSFKDRGDRSVALRPEMTPTVARMVAKRMQELSFPIRWYSIPNLFRYEKPQRGRLREHWQLNVDIFGVSEFNADVEVIQIASQIMKNFGSKPEDFQIKINSRSLMDDLFKKIGIPDSNKSELLRLIDKKEKISEDNFRNSIKDLIGEDKTTSLFENLYYGEGIFSMLGTLESAKYIRNVIQTLRDRGVSNIVFSGTLTRGFDYYTGVVFEVFDTNPENPRSLFGGGRYDNLIELFSNRKVPAFGFGMGDVTIKDFLTTHNLLPSKKSTTDLYICIAPETNIEEVYNIASNFREQNLNVVVDISGKKLAEQLKSLDKRNIPFVTTIGSAELENGKFAIRNTKTRQEFLGNVLENIEFIRSNNQ